MAYLSPHDDKKPHLDLGGRGEFIAYLKIFRLTNIIVGVIRVFAILVTIFGLRQQKAYP